MPPYRILIVDDQRDARRVLRAGLETLGGGLSIADVPSGEEAMLVISRQPVDLLIVDVRLPGISGLELMERARSRNPALKIILITGVEDQRVRKNVKNAGADAFFYKPIDMGEFLQSVGRLLSLSPPEQVETEHPAGRSTDGALDSLGISDRLAALLRELQVSCTILANEEGQVLAQAGDLPLGMQDRGLIRSIMFTLGAGSEALQMIGPVAPNRLLILTGGAYDLIFTPVSPGMGLVVIASEGWAARRRPESYMKALFGAAKDLQAGLSNLWSSSEMQEIDRPSAKPFEDPPLPEQQELLEDLTEIFEQPLDLGAMSVDDFWESALQNSAEQVSGADTISYEQAQQLGLAPQEE